tara:strand:- start:292 stop:1122 length:831 start_codon:yes stop_codon:yes gene_type:complete
MGLSVSDFTIDNASGQSVRLDIQACLKALQGQNAESSDITTQSQCVAGMTFLNTTTNILKVRNSTNGGFTEIGNIDTANLGLLPKSGGTMTGQLLIDDSNSASAPALSFDTDTDLGLFRKSANIMGFSSSGTEQMTFDANGITLNTQNEIRFGDADSSNYVAIKAPSTVSSNRTITLPDVSGTLATTANILTSIQGVDLTGLHTLTPAANNVHSIGSTTLRWANIFTADLDLSNKGSQNDIDGTWGSYKIQEGEEDLYLINRRNGKKYKFNLTEIE